MGIHENTYTPMMMVALRRCSAKMLRPNTGSVGAEAVSRETDMRDLEHLANNGGNVFCVDNANVKFDVQKLTVY
jgi:hypothetical protein